MELARCKLQMPQSAYLRALHGWPRTRVDSVSFLALRRGTGTSVPFLPAEEALGGGGGTGPPSQRPAQARRRATNAKQARENKAEQRRARTDEAQMRIVIIPICGPGGTSYYAVPEDEAQRNFDEIMFFHGLSPFLFLAGERDRE